MIGGGSLNSMCKDFLKKEKLDFDMKKCKTWIIA